MKLSVILSTYNREKVISNAIESVLGQTHKGFEFIIIDNGSTDHTREVIESYTYDQRIIYLSNPEPTNSCDGPRNIGIQHAKSDYIAFLDDDDVWYSNKLKLMAQTIQKHPDVDILCHQENVRLKGKIVRHSQYGPWRENFYERLLYEGNCLSPSAMVIRKKIFDKVGLFDLRKSFDTAADYDMWLRMAKQKYRFHFIQDILGEFTITGNNGSINKPYFDHKILNIVCHHIQSYEGGKKNLSVRGKLRLIQMQHMLFRSYLQNLKVGRSLQYILKNIMILLSTPKLFFPVFQLLQKKINPLLKS